MEFIINTDLEKSLPSVIDFNFEELKSELSGKLSHYSALVVTADTVKDGKVERAKLNKLKAAVEDRRKEVKKLCLAPYEVFETQCKVLTGMIDDASGSIDAQVKSFEDAEKEGKRCSIEAEYMDYIGDLSELLPLDKIFNQKWLNKTTILAAAVAEMQAIIGKVRNDVKVIRAMRCECEDQMLTAYFARLDMSAAMMEKSRYEARQEQMARLAESVPEKTPPPTIETTTAPASEPNTAEATKTIKVVFYDTTAAFRADMKALTKKHNIEYGDVS